MSTGAPGPQDITGRATRPNPTQVDHHDHALDETLDLPKPKESVVSGPLNGHVASPPEIVIVHVRAENDKYALTVHQGDSVHVAEPSDKPPQAMLGEQRTPRTVRSSMITLSQEQKPVANLVKLLAELRDKHRGLCLVITEHTSLGMPWEMAYCPKNDRHLGGLVTTVHLPPDEGDEEESRLLRATEVCAGGLMFLASADVHGLADTSVNGHIQAMEAQDAGGKRDFGRLPHSLKTSKRTDVALVYLLCHGGVDKLNVNDSWLGTLSPDDDNATRITYEALNSMGSLRLFKASKSLVLINACAVGSVNALDLSATDRPLGFPKLFLDQGARGVIGALYKVDVVHAVRLAEDLIQLAKEDQKKPIPELLRTLRERADEKLEEALNDEEVADHRAAFAAWYYTYLYVYYGDPRATLTLDGQGGGS
jgi:hypothetical protein